MAEIHNIGMGKTTIAIDDRTADDLFELKETRKESYDDVIQRLLNDE